MSRNQIFDDPEALARAAAERVAVIATESLAAGGRFRLGLSGGRTPGATYLLLASDPLRSRVDWTRVQIFFADERAVPPTDAESNFRMARETLLDGAGVPPRNVHRMKGEYTDLGAAVTEYESHLNRPLDLLILGVGEDGHTASIFPGSPLVGERTRRVAAVMDAPKPPLQRITLTGRAIGEAREVMVIATGEEKAEAVAAALAEQGSVREIPARLVRGRSWYLDRAAAAQLPKPSK